MKTEQSGPKYAIPLVGKKKRKKRKERKEKKNKDSCCLPINFT